MTCRLRLYSLLYVRCLLDRFQIFGATDPRPLKWKFSKMFFFGFRDGTPKYVSWPNLVEIGRCKLPKGRLVYHTKKPTLRGTRPTPPFCPKWAYRAQNYLNMSPVVARWLSGRASDLRPKAPFTHRALPLKSCRAATRVKLHANDMQVYVHKMAEAVIDVVVAAAAFLRFLIVTRKRRKNNVVAVHGVANGASGCTTWIVEEKYGHFVLLLGVQKIQWALWRNPSVYVARPVARI